MIIRFIMLPILLIIFFSLLPAMVFSEEEKEEKKEPRDLGSTSYLELGFNFGTPVAFNAALGYWFGPIGLRVSGMYWHSFSGIQGNLGIRLAQHSSETRPSLGRWYDPLGSIFFWRNMDD